MHIMGHTTLMKGMQQRLRMQVPGWRGFQLVMGQFSVYLLKMVLVGHLGHLLLNLLLRDHEENCQKLIIIPFLHRVLPR